MSEESILSSFLNVTMTLLLIFAVAFLCCGVVYYLVTHLITFGFVAVFVRLVASVVA